MNERFNLVDERWIPVADAGLVSLADVFTRPELRALGGNPVQKIALMKLLLAIAQAAATPADDHEWRALGADGLAKRCLEYVQKWHDTFYLYGKRPFLQMPGAAKARVQEFEAVLPEAATGNTTVLSQSHIGQPLTDPDKALLLVSLMAFAFAGKKTDNSAVLTPGYNGKVNNKGRPSSGRPGPGLAHFGLLHSFVVGDSLSMTLWLNLLTRKQIDEINMFPDGVGIPPWEAMPEGEDCPVARALQRSLIGRLVPLCRFCLFTNEGLHYTEGLAHASYHDGITDPSTAIDYTAKKPKALWAAPARRPWRDLTALLSFIGGGDGQRYDCWQLRASVGRARGAVDTLAIWSGGLRVRSNAGEQFVSGTDDFVDSEIWLESGLLGQAWFAQLKHEMADLEALEKLLYAKVTAYYRTLKADGTKIAGQATHLFWQLCERDFQQLVAFCDGDDDSVQHRRALRRRFASYLHQSFNVFCPQGTARQLDAWAKCRPSTKKYLQQEAVPA